MDLEECNMTDHDLDMVHDAEFDAVVIEPDSQSTLVFAGGKKYPAKQHARKVVHELGAKSGFIYLPGEPTRNYEDSDQNPEFRQRKYFYYITGVDNPDCAVTYDITDQTLILWIPRVNPRDILWQGWKPDLEEAREAYDVDEVYYTEDLVSYLRKRFRRDSSETMYILHPLHFSVITDAAPALVSTSKDFAAGFMHGAVAGVDACGTRVDHKSLLPAMNAARVVKDDYELAMIRRACQISGHAHASIARRLLRLRNERELVAIFEAESTIHGAHKQAYPVIAGSGENASSLHYTLNDQPLAGKELVLVDAGCEWDNYASDITRTFPLKSGKFEGKAKAIHDLVQTMQNCVLQSVEPGTTMLRLQTLASGVAIRGLVKLGIFKGKPVDIAKKGTIAAFYPHQLGHHVGLEVHDVSGVPRSAGLDAPSSSSAPELSEADTYDEKRLELLRSQVSELVLGSKRAGKREIILPEDFVRIWNNVTTSSQNQLQPGMVVTVEPGIYFCRPYLEGYFRNNPEHADFIDWDVVEEYYPVGGVRIEDVVALVPGGHEILSTAAPKGLELEDLVQRSSS